MTSSPVALNASTMATTTVVSRGWKSNKQESPSPVTSSVGSPYGISKRCHILRVPFVIEVVECQLSLPVLRLLCTGRHPCSFCFLWWWSTPNLLLMPSTPPVQSPMRHLLPWPSMSFSSNLRGTCPCGRARHPGRPRRTQQKKNTHTHTHTNTPTHHAPHTHTPHRTHPHTTPTHHTPHTTHTTHPHPHSFLFVFFVLFLVYWCLI